MADVIYGVVNDLILAKLDAIIAASGGGGGTEGGDPPADPIGPFQTLIATDAPAIRVAEGKNVAAIGTRKGEQRVVNTQLDPNGNPLVLAAPNAASRILSAAATTNATSAKAAAATLFAIHGVNAVASIRYLKIYNKASLPTVGTDTPILTLQLKASSDFSFTWAVGFDLSLGLAYALTTGAADADTGALTAADITCLNVSYA